MNAWLDALRRVLDDLPRPVVFFFRDDDAGWAGERLLELLDLFERHSTPIDLAAIPSSLTRAASVELRARVEAAPRMVAVHQHGFAHLNHEPEGRKCEFGASREASLQQSDIDAGRRRLRDLLGASVGDIFTPPWNRCVAATGECLLRAGFRALSRDLTAAPLGLEGLQELPVTVDWFARRKGVRLSPSELGEQLAAAVTETNPVGLMFHHALMDADEFARAGALLTLLSSHHNSRRSLMSALVAGAAPTDAATRAAALTHTRHTFGAHMPTPAERNRI
jgi:hypothetical protein